MNLLNKFVLVFRKNTKPYFDLPPMSKRYFRVSKGNFFICMRSHLLERAFGAKSTSLTLAAGGRR